MRQVWRVNVVCVIRELRVYNELDAMTIGGRIVNETAQDIVLGNANLLELGTNGLWRLGRATERPAALYIQGHSLLKSMPFLQAGSAPSP